MASMAPRSMPAGLSQMIQSKVSRSSEMTRPTPSSVSASLSRVCDAGSNHRVSSLLSRIKACDSLATPCTTLMRSNTTRRSAPMTRSRLRRPMSKSTTTTFLPFCASAAPSAAVEVVLPTPPLPDVTTSTLAIFIPPSISVERSDPHDVAFKPRLRWSIAESGVELLRCLVIAVDCQKLSLDPLAVDPCPCIAVDARHGAAAQRAVDVDGAAGDDLGARAYRAEHGDVAFGKYDGLAGAHRLVEQQRRQCLHFRLFRLGLADRTDAAAGQQRRHGRREPACVRALDAEHADVLPLEADDQMRDRRGREIERREIKHHRLADEEAG